MLQVIWHILCLPQTQGNWGEVGQVVMEIARLGQNRLQINKPGVRYALKTLPGEFSGLQLVSIMHVGIRQLDAKADPCTGLDREHETAIAMRAKPQ